MIACDNNKENLSNEEDYQDIPGSYRDEEDEDDDETLFSSKCLFIHRFGAVVAVWSLLSGHSSW